MMAAPNHKLDFMGVDPRLSTARPALAGPLEGVCGSPAGSQLQADARADVA
jgi:hypothetical protein